MEEQRYPYAVTGVCVRTESVEHTQEGDGAELRIGVVCWIGTVYASSLEEAEATMLPQFRLAYPEEEGYEAHRALSAKIESATIRSWGYAPRSEHHVVFPGATSPN